MKKLLYMIVPMLLLGAVSCENDGKYYSDSDTLWLAGDSAQLAKPDSVLYSFRLYDFSTQTADINLVVNVAGYAADRDRTFTLEVVADKTNVAATDYKIGTLVVPKGAYKVTVPITANRTIPGLDMTKTAAKLTLRVTGNENFGPGATEHKQYSIMWCDYLTQPPTWSNISYYIGPFSQARYKFIIDYTGYTDFTEFSGNYNKQFWLQSNCIRMLNEYNADPANAGRPEGWPYQNDNGQPLQFGSGLPY